VSSPWRHDVNAFCKIPAISSFGWTPWFFPSATIAAPKNRTAGFDFMKRFLMFAPLTVARGASALFPE